MGYRGPEQPPTQNRAYLPASASGRYRPRLRQHRQIPQDRPLRPAFAMFLPDRPRQPRPPAIDPQLPLFGARIHPVNQNANRYVTRTLAQSHRHPNPAIARKPVPETPAKAGPAAVDPAARPKHPSAPRPQTKGWRDPPAPSSAHPPDPGLSAAALRSPPEPARITRPAPHRGRHITQLCP